MEKEVLNKFERKAKRDLTNYIREITPEDVVTIINELKEVKRENGKLKCEVDSLKEQVQYFIPRRRVRRVYRQLKKILEQDGITDDLDLDD